MTTFLFKATEAKLASSIVRLLDFGETTQAGSTQRVTMLPSADAAASTLSLTFERFQGDLVFDPGTPYHRRVMSTS